ncbi:hypothetical protein PPL_05983 [Heterostelium album PN500]|uniref:Uncharacterized protein n=1 Tax=Heterostelium pallidum (strain ATCC 26659 / Pp 5 / PN500) TaxID=670386 RepID=D3BBW3_HETP5|nr:hypothetical protein PPL_05983 [Heterostelium album PN500]EFA81146.1 hypothetical protein PPL_05983 [Heterostelium album PN500]|eukprot:XP_020433264.1 hypothetical protein PPL_05983 [Heterostelium album PN500]
MSTHTLTQIIPMNADSFYAITETPEFDQFQVPYMGINSLELKEERDEGDVIFRKVCVKPKTSVPAILLKFSSGKSEVSYEDTQLKSKVKREILFKTNPPLLSENIFIEGTITVEPLDDNNCLKVQKINFRFTGPLQWFSSMIEANILSELKKTMETLPKVVLAYKKHLSDNNIPLPVFKPIALNPAPQNYNRNNIPSQPKSPILNNKEPVAQYVCKIN